MYDKVDNVHGEISLVKRTLYNVKVCDNTTPNSDNLGSQSRLHRSTATVVESMEQYQQSNRKKVTTDVPADSSSADSSTDVSADA